jgi:hypothetical protein
MDCGAEVVGGNCSINEYGDQFDLMGPGAPYHYNIFQKERLGWINTGISPSLQTVSSSGIYYVEPYETLSAGSKGLKILRSIDPLTGARTWYYIEHRTPTGFDSGLSAYNIQNGVVFHTATEGDGQDNYLLDMTPLTASWYDSVLALGQTYTDANLGLSVTVLSADIGGATIQVQMAAAQACVRANPTISVTPGRSSWVRPGAAFTYQVTVRNNNSGGCLNETFDLASNTPAGLGATFSAEAINLANGASNVTDMQVMSSAFSADGTFNVGVSATNPVHPQLSASASVQHVIVSSLGVTASAGAARYSRNQTAIVTSIVTAAGAPVSNATVTFTMTKPEGRTVTQTTQTGADGRAVFSFKLERKRDQTGTYSVRSVASFDGYTGQASTTFLVNK